MERVEEWWNINKTRDCTVVIWQLDACDYVQQPPKKTVTWIYSSFKKTTQHLCCAAYWWKPLESVWKEEKWIWGSTEVTVYVFLNAWLLAAGLPVVNSLCASGLWDHTSTEVIWFIWALIDWMLFRIFFWWPANVTPTRRISLKINHTPSLHPAIPQE